LTSRPANIANNVLFNETLFIDHDLFPDPKPETLHPVAAAGQDDAFSRFQTIHFQDLASSFAMNFSQALTVAKDFWPSCTRKRLARRKRVHSSAAARIRPFSNFPTACQKFFMRP
jgi:hypothetical protein